MISYEDYMEIEILRRQGSSLRNIAVENGMAVNKVRKSTTIIHAGVRYLAEADI